MANERMKIVLLKGLEEINDYQFKMIKFLLASHLKLNKKMQEEYDKVHIANLMVDRFQRDSGLDKLIKLCKEIPVLQTLAESLRKEKTKVMKRRSTPAKGKPPSKKNKQDEDSPAVPAPSTSNTVKSEGAEVTPGPQKRKKTAPKNDGSKRKKMSKEQTQPPCPARVDMPTAISHPSPPQTSSAPANMPSIEKPKPQAKPQVNTRANQLQKGPMTVMVLSTTDPFEYESSEKEKKTMFHATVATERKFFHMKVLNINLKKYISRDKIITISDYLDYDHLLEVNEASSVSEAGPEQKLEVPVNLINRAQETLKIDVLQTQASGTVVYGLFMLQKKTVNKNNTVYEIKDDTGNIEVVGKGKCHNIPCEKGDKLELICFRLRKKNRLSKLISEIHSFIQVKPKAKQRKYDSKTVNLPKVQSVVANPSVAYTTPTQCLTQRHSMTPQMQSVVPTRSVASTTPDRTQRHPVTPQMQSVVPRCSVASTTPTLTQRHPVNPQMHSVAPSRSVASTTPARTQRNPVTPQMQSVVPSRLVASTTPACTQRNPVTPQMQSVVLSCSVASTTPACTQRHVTTLQMPPTTTSSSFLTKKGEAAQVAQTSSRNSSAGVLPATNPYVSHPHSTVS
ncbi:pyrin and HIN domain-containing protein 1-like isoform X2 [Nycticebus coucang]|uniref:pyrin and HIN domain-containing protein 1-like isoform X2 n=1 Tax=Nycticebus coucang TaxID=9470 RepID=UPI00234DA25D|nr:pyrin and HIN domain-containing protein 1-like isoform X2 [Nycticebus coucang]